ncbi:MAG: phosphoenolpyruvate--protein phosphotransferase [Spirochaetaceae bacterium]|nr:MAG: phosphoenolpyruvate--protein phosphotransferase [Spirochaetaceae bacterium]
MVGIVIVCHSETLAAAVIALTRQMVPEGIPIAGAGGVEDPQNPFGTDAVKIQSAVESVFSESGVLVLMDLGSALLSADTALELLGEQRARQVRLCAAPLVEGSLAAAVKAAAGGSLEECAAEAETCLQAKRAHLGTVQVDTPAVQAGEASPAGDLKGIQTAQAEARVLVRNALGLHARPAARFVQTASRFRSSIFVSNLSRGGGPVSALSLNGLATLGIGQGQEMLIQAGGEDGEAAVAELVRLVESGFGEATPKQPPTGFEGLQPPEAPLQGLFSPFRGVDKDGRIAGLPASPGIALGPALLLRRRIPEIPSGPGRGAVLEQARLDAALKAVRLRMEAMSEMARRRAGEAEADIFQAYALSLADPALTQRARAILLERNVSAELAWSSAASTFLELYEGLEAPYMKARSRDLADLLNQVLLELAGSGESATELIEPAVVLAEDLSPSELIRLGPQKVTGIALARGGIASHAAILARSLLIPTVVNLGSGLLDIESGIPVALDGGSGTFWIDPGNKEELEQWREHWLKQRDREREQARRPAVTVDGEHIRVLANVQQAGEAATAVQWGAEGIGVLRSELLYLEREQPPPEEEQIGAYRSAAEVLPGWEVAVRTLDLGGDKLPDFLRLPGMENPFLGLRGSRLYPEIPEIIRTQLRAILRAGADHPLKVLFPMVATVEELSGLRQLVEEVQKDLAEEGLPHDAAPKVGVMIEVPSAALQAEHLARSADFFSIGTNDLCQYVFAVERTCAELAELADPLHPALLNLIDLTAKAGKAAGIPVAVCGELAAVPLAVPLLVGLGVGELSASPPAIPVIKQTLERVSAEQAREIAAEALSLDSAGAVRALLARHYPELK